MSNVQTQPPINIQLSQSKIKSTLITFGIGALAGIAIMVAVYFIFNLGDTSGALERARATVSELEGTVHTLNEQVTTIDDELGVLRDQHELDLEEIGLLNQSLDGLTVRFGQVAGELRTINSQLTIARERITDITGEADIHARRARALETRVGELEGEIGRLRTIVGGYGAAIESAVGGIESSDERIRLALDTISGITAEIDRLLNTDSNTSN